MQTQCEFAPRVWAFSLDQINHPNLSKKIYPDYIENTEVSINSIFFYFHQWLELDNKLSGVNVYHLYWRQTQM